MTTTVEADLTIDAETERFIHWLLLACGFELLSHEDSVYTASVPESLRAEFADSATVRFPLASPAPEGTESIRPSTSRFTWLLLQLPPLSHAIPAHQPAGVHEITSQLFRVYQVDNGRVQLRGCLLDECPLLRVSYLSKDDKKVTHEFVTTDGKPVDGTLVEQLMLHEITARQTKPPRVAEQAVQWQKVADEVGPGDQGSGAHRIAVTVVWCQYVSGSIAASIGDQSVDVPFEGWAQLLASGKVKPPPYTCPITGKQSYHLAADDQGRITAAEAIGICEESGERVIETELQKCAVTGKRVKSENLAVCPVSNEPVLTSQLVTCPTCLQQVAPTVLASGGCRACRGTSGIRKDDPRMARVLGEHPKLDRWRKWRISETRTVYILVATSLLRRLLVELDKETLEAQRVATASRFGGWVDVPEPQLGEYVT